MILVTTFPRSTTPRQRMCSQRQIVSRQPTLLPTDTTYTPQPPHRPRLSLFVFFPLPLIQCPLACGREDSSTALSITTLLRELTRKGMIVVCSIHQPRSSIFSVFDKVLFLNKGKTVYYGEQCSAVNYFTGLGGYYSSRAIFIFSWVV